MGYYLDLVQMDDGRNVGLEARGKVTRLKAECKAIELDSPPDFDAISPKSALICVIHNGAFEAAAYTFSKDKYEQFNDPRDNRPKRWLLMDKAIVEKSTGFNL